MAKRIVQTAPTPSTSTNKLAASATDYLASMGKFFDMARREISEGNSTDFDGIEFLVKGASAETFRFGDALSKMTNQHVGGELSQEGSEVTKMKLSESDLERIALDIATVTSLIKSIQNLAKQITKADVGGIEAMCEKAGFISDRCAQALGEIAFCGSWEAWAGVEWPDAQVTQHA